MVKLVGSGGGASYLGGASAAGLAEELPGVGDGAVEEFLGAPRKKGLKPLSELGAGRADAPEAEAPEAEAEAEAEAAPDVVLFALLDGVVSLAAVRALGGIMSWSWPYEKFKGPRASPRNNNCRNVRIFNVVTQFILGKHLTASKKLGSVVSRATDVRKPAHLRMRV